MMRFIIDECTGPVVARKLHELGHDVFSVYEQARGIDDDEVLNRAQNEGRILITNDKDFGEKVYRDGKLHSGIILLRLRDQSAYKKSEAIMRLLEFHLNKIETSFIVITDKQVRFAKLHRM